MSVTPWRSSLLGMGSWPHSGMPGAPRGPALRSTSTESAVTSRSGSSKRAIMSRMSSNLEPGPALEFFTDSASTLLMAAKNAAVQHYVLLSIVGVDGIDADGYLRGKLLQEELVSAAGVPYTIVRATQFHEFTEGIADSLVVDGEIRAPDALIQPVAAAEVAGLIARVATEAPRNGVLELGGPEKMPFAEMAHTVFTLRGKNVPITVDPQATYFGVPVERNSLVTDDGAELGSTRLIDWLGRR